MKTIIFNDDHLTMNDIEEKKTKVRGFIINENDEVFLSQYAGMYMLPGGKLEKGEEIHLGLTREIKEELGIMLDLTDNSPFLLIQQWIKAYPKRNKEHEVSNRLLETYYFLVYSDNPIQLNQRELTEQEQKENMIVFQIKVDRISSLLEKNETKNPRNKYFTRELMTVLQEVERTKK